ncbi:hypothetical protein AB0D57_14805 [Streptomyces sp. NPDC048275]|uniref:hypothetical protein n=1 Tax=Streptomyces sp. NPDC048275 TaxID=3155629 RepID=UPI003405B890
MSPIWDNEPEHAEGVCVACGVHTNHGIVRWLPRISGPDVRLIVHAEAQDCTPPQPVGNFRLSRHGSGL